MGKIRRIGGSADRRAGAQGAGRRAIFRDVPDADADRAQGEKFFSELAFFLFEAFTFGEYLYIITIAVN